MAIEREVKLGVWPGFSMPALDGLAQGATVEALAEQRLEAVYHDTPDLRLARSGITLRHRTGEDSGETWTLKLPKGTAGDSLLRDEQNVPGELRSVPGEIRSMLTAWVRTSSLQPVARLHTLRARTIVRDSEGKQLAEVVDDEVSVLDGRRVALRFREVEVEVDADAPGAVLDSIVLRLRAAGAGQPDPTAKVIRALGPRALEPPDLAPVSLPKKPSAAEVLRAGVTKAVQRILEHDAGVRIGEDAEAVHQARVGTRRLRSDLRTFAPLLDAEWSEALRGELSWYADLLGEVRDTDVLLERLTADIATLDPSDRPHGDPILAVLRSHRDVARAALLRGMASARYRALLESLVDAARDPRVLPEASNAASDAVPALVRRPWSKLAKAAKAAGPDAPDEVLHDIRIRAKRCRYAADVAALVIGKPAARFGAAVATVQEVLGDHHDACVTRAWLRTAAASADAPTALVAGQLIAKADAHADDGRRAWPEAWKQASRGRLRTWLTA